MLEREVLNGGHADREPAGGAGIWGQATCARLAVLGECCVEPIGETTLTKGVPAIGEARERDRSQLSAAGGLGVPEGRRTYTVTTWCVCIPRNRWRRLGQSYSTRERL